MREIGALTPVELRHGVWYKREDLFKIAGVSGGKARTCYMLARAARRGLITASARQSPQAFIVARIAEHLDLRCRVHTPSGYSTPELAEALRHGAMRVAHVPGYNSVIVARARSDAERSGMTLVPFGMECADAVKAVAAQTQNLPREVQRIVVPVGSGMTLAGILVGLERAAWRAPVIGVMVGANPRTRLDRWAPSDWRRRVRLVASAIAYHEPGIRTACGGLTFDPWYESKCLAYLREGDCFWVVGNREGTLRPRSPKTRQLRKSRNPH
jgi:threonine dehydratase